MNPDVSSRQFQQWIKQARQIIIDYFDRKDEVKVFAGKSPRNVLGLFDEPLPNQPSTIENVLEKVGKDVLDTITNRADPRYFRSYRRRASGLDGI